MRSSCCRKRSFVVGRDCFLPVPNCREHKIAGQLWIAASTRLGTESNSQMSHPRASQANTNVNSACKGDFWLIFWLIWVLSSSKGFWTLSVRKVNFSAPREVQPRKVATLSNFDNIGISAQKIRSSLKRPQVLGANHFVWTCHPVFREVSEKKGFEQGFWAAQTFLVVGENSIEKPVITRARCRCWFSKG